MIRTHGEGKVYHGEDAARTAGNLWRDGDVFVVNGTGASYVRTGGAWVQISVGSGTTDHNSLANFDGGTTNEYYHLTATQHTDLTDGGDTTLHAHDAYIANSLLSARGDIIVRNATIPERLALTVPSAPTISFLGVINGETQPTWKSASSAPGAAAAVLQTKATGELRLGAVLQIVGDTFPTTGAGLELGGNGVYSVIESINHDTSTGMPIYFNYGITGDMIFNAGASLGNIQLGDTQNRSGTVSTKAINIFNGTAPVGLLANGFTLYSSGGAPYVMDAAGTARNLMTAWVESSVLNANTILYAVSDNTPAALSVAEGTLVGRMTGGNIDDLSASDTRTVLGLGTMATEAATDYIANSLLTARGDIITRNATIPERLALTVPASPTINFLGVANGETQPSWKSASSAGGADAHIVATDASGYTSVVKLGIGGAPSNYLDIVLPAGNMLEKGISLSRDGGYGLLGNATSASDAFVPMFIGKASVTNGAMYFIGLQPDSSSTAAPLIFQAENGSGAAIDATDELMRINNYATRLITIFGSGGMVIGNPTITSGCKLDIIGGDIRTDGVYRTGTATGTTANVDVAKVGGGTRTLIFVGGLYTGYTDS